MRSNQANTLEVPLANTILLPNHKSFKQAQIKGTASHRDLILQRQRYKCCGGGNHLLYPHAVLDCGRPHPRAATIKHLRRRADGGDGSLDNKAVACLECNSDRGSTDWMTYKSMKMAEI